MYYLSLNSLIFNSLLLSFLSSIFIKYFFLWNIINIFICMYMWDIFCLMFNCIIISKPFFVWNSFNFLDSLIINMTCFIRNIFNSTFSFNILLLLYCSTKKFLFRFWYNHLLNLLLQLYRLLYNLLNWLLNYSLLSWLLYLLWYTSWNLTRILIICNCCLYKLSVTGYTFVYICCDLLRVSLYYFNFLFSI